MKTIALLALLSVGCIVRNPANEAKMKAEDEQERRALVQQERREAEAARTVAIRANAERVLNNQRAAREQAKADKIEKERQECAAGRDARVQDQARHDRAIEQRNELHEWEAAHCKWVERPGAPTVYLTQNARGEYGLKQGNGNAVDRKCNAPVPEDLKHGEASNIFVPQPTYALGCEKYDAEATR